MRRTNVALTVIVIAGTIAAIANLADLRLAGLEPSTLSIATEASQVDSPWNNSTSAGPVLISVERYVDRARESSDPLGDVRTVAKLSERLAKLDVVEAVLSVTTASDIDPVPGALLTVPLLPAITISGVTAAEKRIEGSALFTKALLSADATRWNIWVDSIDSPDTESVLARIRGVLDTDESDEGVQVQLMGEDALDAAWKDIVRRDALVLGTTSALVALVVLSLIAGGLWPGLVLWATVIAAGVWTIALFPIFGEHLTWMGLIVPLEGIALATSYGVHLHRFHVVGGPSEREIMRHARPVILTAASTTALGFVTFLVVRTARVSTLGLFLAASVAFAVLAVFTVVPLDRRLARPRTQRPDADARPGPHIAAVTKFWFVPVIVTVGLAIGLTNTTWGNSLAGQLRSGSVAANIIETTTEHYGGDEEFSVILDTGSEYGLIDEQALELVHEAQEMLERTTGVYLNTTVLDVARWANGRLEGSSVDIDPADPVQFAESLEIAYSAGLGMVLDNATSRDYRQARFTVRLRSDAWPIADRRELMFGLVDDLNSLADRAGSKAVVSLSGPTYSSVLAHEKLKLDIRDMLLVFVPSALLVLFVLSRSAIDAATMLAPALLSLAGALGLYGHLGIPLTVDALFITATLLGVGIDDAVIVVTVFRRYERSMPAEAAVAATLRDAGVAALQTTAVLCTGMLVFLLSDHVHLCQDGVVLIAGLLISTALTVCAVPRLLVMTSRVGSDSRTKAGDQR